MYFFIIYFIIIHDWKINIFILYYNFQYILNWDFWNGGNQGTNAKKVILEVCAFFVLPCTGHILVIGNCFVNFQNYQNWMLFSSSDTKRHWCIYSCLQIPPRENWFQYVRRVYGTAIIFHCITTLGCRDENTH